MPGKQYLRYFLKNIDFRAKILLPLVKDLTKIMDIGMLI